MDVQLSPRTMGTVMGALGLLLISSCKSVSDHLAIGNGCYVNIVGKFEKMVAEDETRYFDESGSRISFHQKKVDMFSKELPWGSIEVEERLFNDIKYKHAVHTMSQFNAKEDIYLILLRDGYVLLTGPVVKNGIADVVTCEQKRD